MSGVQESGSGGNGWVSRFAPAKINPHLDVLARRADGYHEVRTTLLALDLGDSLAVRWRAEPGIELHVGGPACTPDVPRDERNLVWRAAEETLATLGVERGVEVRLTKRVPSEAGLGGGSSDAAATVALIEALHGAELSDAAAEALLGGLGADCNFFRNGLVTGFAVCTGRGEHVAPRPLDDGHWHVALTVPAARASTAAVYAALDLCLSDPRAVPRVALESLSGPETAVRCRLFNRLEPAALQVAPDLQAWRTLFDEVGAEHYRLSGSGSAFYGLFRDRDEAGRSQDRIAAAAERAGLGMRGQWLARPLGAGPPPVR